MKATLLSRLLGLLVIICFASSGMADELAAFHTEVGSSWFHTGAGIARDGDTLFDNREAQTFKSLASGQVTTVGFTVTRIDSTDTDLRISIMTMQGGQPFAVLGTALIDKNSIFEGSLSGRPQLNMFVDFSEQDVQLEFWRDYALVFQSDTSHANYRLYGSGRYDRGVLLSSQNGSPYSSGASRLSLLFSVQIVPEPGSLLLFGVGALLLQRMRR